MVEAAWDFLNGEDLPTLPVSTQAELLQAWSRLQAKESAAYASLIGAFHAANGPAADGQRSVGAWLARFTRCTPAAGRRAVGWSLRQLGHAHVHQSLSDGQVAESVGQSITDLVKAFEPADRDTVEDILTEAARSGAELGDLVEIHNAALRRLRPNGLEDEEARRDAERNLTLSKTLGGVGRLNGDLTAEGTALAETVIEALAVRQGPEDTRTKTQRRHDALVEAMRRLAASDLLPERGGSKPQVKVDMDLATLRNLPGSRQAEREWIEHTAANLARRRFHGDTTNDLFLHDDGRTNDPPSEPPSEPPSGSASGSPSGSASADGIQADAETGTGVNTDPDNGHAHQTDAEGDAQADTETTQRGIQSDSDTDSDTGQVTEPGTRPVDGLDAGPADGREGGHLVRAYDGLVPDAGSGLGSERVGASDADRSMRPPGPVQPRLPGLDEGAVLEGIGAISNTLAAALACDSTITPTVTADIDYDALNAMTDQWLTHCLPQSTTGATCTDIGCGCDPGSCLHARRPLDAGSYSRLQAGMLRWAIQVLSGPRGLASYLRTRLLDRPLAGPSIVLDAGKDDKTVPAALERSVRRRDQRCRFPGCDHPASLSQVHHIVPRSKDGPTELWNLLTLCSFHHLIAVHSWGWEIRLDPDGSTTATAPDGREIHEHSPPGTPPLWAA
ncbi:HNH endonuclease signature motif containing protein [Actinomadura sp. HBU206391]|uniref:HNH endonuclease signature motif containing protein n=1 Tax=Actinomadura sp. HBU206391 TaxID=2731692 RepID=UPI0021C7AD24|nr:HNH endonuclease signature motif containing protein [Actinomadura sp. HBU206391]